MLHQPAASDRPLLSHLHMMELKVTVKMPLTDILSSDTTYICYDDPAADYSRACALVASTSWQRGMTSAILLKFPHLRLIAGTTLERAELILHPWQNRGTEIHPAFHVYLLETDFTSRLATWDRHPMLSDYPQASQSTSACQDDGAIHCDVTCLAMQWTRGTEGQCGIALVAEPETCLMIHSGCSDRPPCLRLFCCANGTPAIPIEEPYPGACAPKNENCCNGKTSCGYQEKTFTLHIYNDIAYTPAVDIAQARTVTFLIRNDSRSTMEVRLQISPNGQDWMDDRQCVAVPAEGLAAITPYLFARYIRLSATLPDVDTRAKARVWFQAQTFNCTTLG